jgi:tyrosine-protein kinase Etk/Wzc
MFNLKSDNGLSEYLINDISLTGAIKPTEIENLSIASCGKIPQNPSELFMGARFSQFIEQVSKAYNLITIDTPPILAVSDAAIIGQFAGKSLILAGFNQSSVKEVSVNRFELNGVDIKGFIFNAVEKKTISYYGDNNYEYKTKG